MMASRSMIMEPIRDCSAYSELGMVRLIRVSSAGIAYYSSDTYTVRLPVTLGCSLIGTS